jgi:hypothetical protein
VQPFHPSLGARAIPGIFVVKGWHADAARVIERVVAAEDAEAAKNRAKSEGLSIVLVSPYAPVSPGSDEFNGGE